MKCTGCIYTKYSPYLTAVFQADRHSGKHSHRVLVTDMDSGLKIHDISIPAIEREIPDDPPF